MTGEEILLTGVWTQVVGTVIAAIGETIVVKNDGAGSPGYRLVSIGNGFEGAGNSLQGVGAIQLFDGTEPELLRIMGDWIQASGNATNTVAAELQFSGEETEGLKLDVIGDSFQAIGLGLEAYGASNSKARFKDLLAAGNTIQLVGAVIEGVGENFILRGKSELGLQITAFGSYAQVAGASMAAVALTMEASVGINPE
ncbi:hypothetical protein LCM10_13255 [Rossellomorea aquimaris]|uniref:DUF6944 family repetitive protein n=1 Tax=Rossellomorea aquimaris TaxID=189382 RepID=UPI001CD494C9|nr:hypothetical protein [Rossellomorea aquimaris]MCA1055959.1 hypothetical protein [Rossellomorea aquimaris]